MRLLHRTQAKRVIKCETKRGKSKFPFAPSITTMMERKGFTSQGADMITYENPQRMTSESKNSRTVYYGHGPWPAPVHRCIINNHLKNHNHRRMYKRRFSMTHRILKRDCNTVQRIFDRINYNNNNSTPDPRELQQMKKSIVKQQAKQITTDFLVNESIRLVNALKLVAPSPTKPLSLPPPWKLTKMKFWAFSDK